MSDLEKLCRNAVDVIDREDLAARLKEGKPLRVKAGFDPSAPDIHLGHTVLLRKLREFQDLGHKVIFIVGDYTATIGDPTGRSKTRPALSRSEVEANAKTYQDQAFKILSQGDDKIEIIRNSEWFNGPNMFRIFLENVCSNYTVDQILAREDFDKRRKENKAISIRELMYPLLQGYDSVKVKADIELGGTDQKFNLLVGRNLQRSFNQRPQIVMTLPLLVGLDGSQKMSKSYGNYIGVLDTPKEIFGKAMSLPDSLMESYYDLLVNLDAAERVMIEGMINASPKEAKVLLAKMLVAQLHDSQAAEKEAAEFDRVFSKKEAPQNPEELRIAEKEIWIVDLLKRAGAATSTSEARRLIEQGAVSVDGEKISDFNAKIPVKKGALVKIGKKIFLRLKQ